MGRKRTHRAGFTRSGFTLLELLLTLTVLGLVGFRTYGALNTMKESVEEENVEAEVEEQARGVLRKIAYEVMSSDRETLDPDSPAPMGTTRLRYRVSLGVQDGEVVWKAPVELSLEEEQQQVIWAQNPETLAEQRVVWSNLVSPYLAGEIPDGMDNNGNGLIDERGLSFELDGNAVTIRLTLEKIDANGESVTKTVETTVTCRNWVQEGVE